MNIIYFSQFFVPEPIAGAFRAYENACCWQQLGNDVTVFTGYPNYPKGVIFEGYTPKLLSEESIDAIRVLRNKLIAVPNTSIVNRLRNALSYYYYGRLNTLIRDDEIWKDYQIVVGSSGPIFNAYLAYSYAKKHNLPFVFDIRDITYIQMQATGKRESSLSVQLMKSLELHLCKKSNIVVTVTNGFRKVLVDRGIDESKIYVITNGVDIDEMPKREYENQFILSYFGTLGISQNILDTLIYTDYIDSLLTAFSFLIIGEGAQKEQIKKATSNRDYISMYDGMPSRELDQYYSKSILSLITLRDSSSFKYTIPSKLFQIMGRGIAVLYIGPKGECADIIQENDAGICLTGDIDENMRILQRFFELDDWKDQLIRMGKNGRKVVEAKYTRTHLATEYLELLKNTYIQRK